MNLPFMLIFHICLFIFLNCVSEDKQYRVSLPHSFKFSHWGKKKNWALGASGNFILTQVAPRL